MDKMIKAHKMLQINGISAEISYNSLFVHIEGHYLELSLNEINFQAKEYNKYLKEL